MVMVKKVKAVTSEDGSNSMPKEIDTIFKYWRIYRPGLCLVKITSILYDSQTKTFFVISPWRPLYEKNLRSVFPKLFPN